MSNNTARAELKYLKHIYRIIFRETGITHVGVCQILESISVSE